PRPRDGSGGKALLAECDLENLVHALAAGHAHLDLVAGLFAQERSGERARDADRAGVDVALVRADDAVGHFLVGLGVREADRAAERDLVACELLRVDDLGARELVLDLLDAPLDERLAVPGGVVLRVFAEVAVVTRDGDGLDDRRALDALEMVELLAKLRR